MRTFTLLTGCLSIQFFNSLFLPWVLRISESVFHSQALFTLHSLLLPREAEDFLRFNLYKTPLGETACELLLCFLVAWASSFLILYFSHECYGFQRAFFTLRRFLPYTLYFYLRKPRISLELTGILSMYLRLHT